MGDFRLDANFQEALDYILDDAELSLRPGGLELIAGLLNRLEPALLQGGCGMGGRGDRASFHRICEPHR